MTSFINESQYPRLRIDIDSEFKALVHLDAGHGGTVNGVYQTAGKQWKYDDFTILEGVENRNIVKQLVQKFYTNHISYNLTTISNKDESLADRMEYLERIVKAYPKLTHVFLSVHHDATEKESNAKGVSFYTTPGITDSDYASNYYFPYLYDLGMKVRVNREVPNQYDKEASFYVIRKAEKFGCMAMLFELGFMTNREEALKIMQPEHHEAAAAALYKGTVDLLNKIKRDGTVR
jgi:N-acetylmuramoyl-L-alanine amidase